MNDLIQPHLELNEHYAKRKEEHLSRLRLAIPEEKAYQVNISCWTDYSELVFYLMDNNIIREYDTDILALLIMYNKEWYFMKHLYLAKNVNWEYILQLIFDVSPRPYLFLTRICQSATYFQISPEFFENIKKQIYDKREEYELMKKKGDLENIMSVEDWLNKCTLHTSHPNNTIV